MKLIINNIFKIKKAIYAKLYFINFKSEKMTLYIIIN